MAGLNGKERCERDHEKAAREHLEAARCTGAARARRRRCVQRHLLRGAGRSVRRNLLQHLSGGLPRGDHRPELRGPDHHDDLPPDRQLRCEPRGLPVREAGTARARRARHVPGALELAQRAFAARLFAREQRRRHRGRRHARPRSPRARQRRPARGALHSRHRRREPPYQGARKRVHRRREPR